MANIEQRIAGTESFRERVERLKAEGRLKPPTAMERKAAADEIDARFERIKARWAADAEAYWAEQADEPDDDDAPEPRKIRGNRRPLIFRERDIKRAIAGHMKAGLSVKRTEIDASGRIVIVTGQHEPVSVAPENEWDAVR